MPKNAKGAKSTKKGRTKVKNLPVSEKELTAKEKKHVKGGIGLLTPSPAVTLTTPSVTVGVGHVSPLFDSEFVLKKR